MHCNRLLLTSLVSLLLIPAGEAAIIGTALGSGAPPATLGGFALSACPLDARPLFVDVPDLPCLCGPIGFSIPLNHRRIGSGWATWSHGYTGDVYYTNGHTSVTLLMPADLCAIVFYAEPNPFTPVTITATANDGTSVTQVANGSAGAAGYGFHTTGGTTITAITVTAGTDFAVGEFYMACCPPVDPCRVNCPRPTQNICYEAGRDDNFAAPQDPASPRPALAALLTCTLGTMQFDQLVFDRCFGHTFTGLPSGVVAARLELRIRAIAGLATNDSIGLGAVSGSFAWGRRIGTESGGPTGILPTPWSSGRTEILCLDLCRLPNADGTTTNILPQINAARALDVFIQDDTAVDYARLTITICPCENPSLRTLQAGLADNFRGKQCPPSGLFGRLCQRLFGDPPPYRSPILNALRTTWKGFDSNTANRGFGHTFTGIPSGAVRAELEIRMKPHRDLPFNDSLNLALKAPGAPAQFWWGSAISSLPGSGGSWLVGGSPRTFTLDLGALPTPGGGCAGCPSAVLGSLASGKLDVYVQDDTSVDYMRLRVWSCPRRFFLFGISHETLAGAMLAAHPSGALAIDQIGSTGEDGVRMELGTVDGFALQWAVPTETLASGSSITFGSQGVADGEAGQELGTVTLVFDVDEHTTHIVPDYSPVGSQTQRLIIYRDGQPVQTIAGHVGAIAAPKFCPGDWRCPSQGGGCSKRIAILDGYQTACYFLRGGPGDEFAFSPAGWPGEPIVGDAILILAENPAAPLERIVAVSVTGVALPELLISDLGVVLDSRVYRALGLAQLQADGELLTVGDLGSSGNDGVSIDVGEIEFARVRLAPVDPDDAAPGGASLELRATGRSAGVSGTPFGSMLIDKSTLPPHHWSISTDFTPIGSTSYVVRVYERGVLRLLIPSHTGPIAQAQRAPDALMAGHWDEAPDLTAFWNEPLEIRVGGEAQPVIGDELRIVPLGHTADFEAVEHVELRASGIEELIVLGDYEAPFELLGDTNCDGFVDFDDIDAFVLALVGRASYEAQHADCVYANADANGDGFVDFDDIGAFVCCLISGSCDDCLSGEPSDPK